MNGNHGNHGMNETGTFFWVGGKEGRGGGLVSACRSLWGLHSACFSLGKAENEK